MKKALMLALSVIMVASLVVGCAAPKVETTQPSPAQTAAPSAEPAAPKVSFPDGKPITMIVPWSAGGGSDIGARMVQPYLEEYLHTTVNVINPTGASGWVGWEQMLAGKADGYTVAMVNFPTLMPGYLDPSLGRSHNLESFTMLANHVTDSSVIVIKNNDPRFSDLKSFVEYAKSKEVTASTSGPGSDDHVLLETVNAKAGLKLTQVPGNGWKDGYAALLGGHIDSSIANVGEVMVPCNNGELTCIAVFSDKRSDFMPDVPTWKEVMGTDISVSSQRGFACKAGTPQEIVDLLGEALKYAITKEEQVKKMAELGLAVDYIGSTEYTKHLKNEEKTMMDMSEIMGWK